MVEVGKKYSTKELCEAIGVTYDNFKKQKNAFLKKLSMAYDYEVEYKGRATFYTITKQIGEYQKPERKNSRKKIDKTIQEFINEVIDEDPYQTAANINRRAWEHADTNPSTIVLLGLKDSTTGEYIRLNLREMYGTKEHMGGTDGMIERKVWCRLDKEYNTYVEMAEEVVKDLYACFEKARGTQKKIDMDVYADYDAGLITREEMTEQLIDVTHNTFAEGKKLFFEKHGYYPIKVPVYLRGAWKQEDKAYNL